MHLQGCEQELEHHAPQQFHEEKGHEKQRHEPDTVAATRGRNGKIATSGNESCETRVTTAQPGKRFQATTGMPMAPRY